MLEYQEVITKLEELSYKYRPHMESQPVIIRFYELMTELHEWKKELQAMQDAEDSKVE